VEKIMLTVKLNNGVEIPNLGFGVFQINENMIYAKYSMLCAGLLPEF
jgi:diketogulonate reductase-like aldo/keto reductase